MAALLEAWWLSAFERGGLLVEAADLPWAWAGGGGGDGEGEGELSESDESDEPGIVQPLDDV